MGRTPAKQRLPRTRGQLRAWLRGSQLGRSLLRELVEDVFEERCRACERGMITPRPKVLVVARRLGPLPGVEVYAERRAHVRLEELVDTHARGRIAFYNPAGDPAAPPRCDVFGGMLDKARRSPGRNQS